MADFMKIVLLLSLTLLFSGCASMMPQQRDVYKPVMPQAYKELQPVGGSIYQAGRDVRLFEDVKARRIGDVITVVLAERTVASKSASISTDKGTGFSISNPTLFGGTPAFNLPGGVLDTAGKNGLSAALSAEREFDGSGSTSQSNSLSGNITVTIADVLPNGNLVIRGEKWVTLNQGEEFIQISGIVRPQDVSTVNTVESTLIADAHITYSGKGVLAESNEMGWLARFFNHPIFPF